MEESDKLNIHIVILDKKYALSIKPEDEEGIRKAAKELNMLIRKFQQHFTFGDQIDFLALAALNSYIDLEHFKCVANKHQIKIDFFMRNDPFVLIGDAERKVSDAISVLKNLPPGKVENVDKRYEKMLCSLLPILLWGEFDFPKEQPKTNSKKHIRDLGFYNCRQSPFTNELYEKYSCSEVVFEFKNVNELESQYINQMNRYLTETTGYFGIIITRNNPAQKIMDNIIDLWSSKRKCILVLNDNDILKMCEIYLMGGKTHRTPIDVIKDKHSDFLLLTPA